jgi:hypothetical protein
LDSPIPFNAVSESPNERTFHSKYGGGEEFCVSHEYKFSSSKMGVLVNISFFSSGRGITFSDFAGI